MGFWSREAREARKAARPHVAIQSGKLNYRLRFEHPIAGARAEITGGTSRTSTGRVIAGALVAGPIGAVVGASAKRSAVSIVITYANGQQEISRAPIDTARKESTARRWVVLFNNYAQESLDREEPSVA